MTTNKGPRVGPEEVLRAATTSDHDAELYDCQFSRDLALDLLDERARVVRLKVALDRACESGDARVPRDWYSTVEGLGVLIADHSTEVARLRGFVCLAYYEGGEDAREGRYNWDTSSAKAALGEAR